MQQVVMQAAASQDGHKRPTGHLPQQGQHQLGAANMPVPQNQTPIQGLPQAQQQRLWAAQQAHVLASQVYSGARPPPPPHLPPSVQSESPMSDPMSTGPRRMSLSCDLLPNERTPNQASMPPPAWIPSHGFSRPPVHTAPDGSAVQPPSPHVVPVKEWESVLRLDLPITDITPLATQDADESSDPTFGGRLLPMTRIESEQVLRWLERDKAFAAEMEGHKAKMQKKMLRWAANNDMGTPWWQVRKGGRHRPSGTRLSIVWPADKVNIRAGSTHRHRKQIRL